MAVSLSSFFSRNSQRIILSRCSSFCSFFNRNQELNTRSIVCNHFIDNPFGQYCSSISCRLSKLKQKKSSRGNISMMKRMYGSGGAFFRSFAVLEKIDGKIPNLGDSITHVTLLEWATSIGQILKEGDVVATIETDKVTVDVIAEVDGMLIEKMAKCEDTVLVGSTIYRIDTTVTPTANTSNIFPNENTQGNETSSDTSSIISSSTIPLPRTPSMKFLGKQGWQARQQVTSSLIYNRLTTIDHHQPQQQQTAMKSPTTTTTKDNHQSKSRISNTIMKEPNTVHMNNYMSSLQEPIYDICPDYGRLSISEREIEALMMGGASELPC